jgi:hypothetical protein
MYNNSLLRVSISELFSIYLSDEDPQIAAYLHRADICRLRIQHGVRSDN